MLVVFFASDLIAQDFEVVDFVEVIADGEGHLGQQIGGSFNNFGCLRVRSININGVDLSVQWSRWQWRASPEDDWQTAEESHQDNGICGLDLADRPGGQYRWVAQLVVGDRLIATEPIDQEGPAHTAVRAATWGLVKARGQL